MEERGRDRKWRKEEVSSSRKRKKKKKKVRLATRGPLSFPPVYKKVKIYKYIEAHRWKEKYTHTHSYTQTLTFDLQMSQRKENHHLKLQKKNNIEK